MNNVDKYITVPLDTIQRINTGELSAGALAFLVTALMAGIVVLAISSEYVSESRAIGLSAAAFIICAVLGGWMITSGISTVKVIDDGMLGGAYGVTITSRSAGVVSGGVSTSRVEYIDGGTVGNAMLVSRDHSFALLAVKSGRLSPMKPRTARATTTEHIEAVTATPAVRPRSAAKRDPSSTPPSNVERGRSDPSAQRGACRGSANADGTVSIVGDCG